MNKKILLVLACLYAVTCAYAQIRPGPGETPIVPVGGGGGGGGTNTVGAVVGTAGQIVVTPDGTGLTNTISKPNLGTEGNSYQPI